MIRRSHAISFVLPFAAVLSVAACTRKPNPAEVTVSLSEAPGTLSSATVLIDYSQASATPLRSGGGPSCASIVPNLTAEFSDDGQGRITMHATAPQGFSAPVDLAVCRMVPDAPDITGQTIASRLRVSVVAGSDIAGKPLDEQRIARGGRGPAAGAGREDDGGDASARSARRGAAGERATDAPQAAQAPAEDAGSPAGEARDDERLAAAAQPDAERLQPRAAAKNELMRGDRAPANSGSPAPPAPSGGDSAGDSGDGGDQGRADSNEDSDTDRAARSYAVTVSVTNPSGRLGALQFDIVHQGGSGGFAGAAASARCSAALPAALAQFNDRGNGTVSGALVDLNGIDTPGPVATCTFKSRGSVSAGDFSVKVVDAANPEGDPPTQHPQMAVIDVRALN